MGRRGAARYHFPMHADSVNIGLAARLRAGTATLHRQVERSGLMAQLLRGRISRRAYCGLLRNLHVIYKALEDGLAHHATRPELAPLCLSGLMRTNALETDLATLHGSTWRHDIVITDCAADYARHLLGLSDTRPELLAAHSYVRHLGDLHGGQVLKRIVSSSLGLNGHSGTRFHTFECDVAGLIARYRTGLDALPNDDATVDALVAEAQSGFRRHIVLFEALA